MPLHKLKWLPTRQPVVTDLWKTRSRAGGTRAVFTSIANWSTSGLKDIEWRGEKYLWSKSREFLRFVAAPKKIRRTVRARDRHQGREDARRIPAQRLAFPRTARDERRLLAVSRLHPALERRVHRRERSICAAAHRLVQRPQCLRISRQGVLSSRRETGFTDHYGNDGGLFAFESLGQIAESVREISDRRTTAAPRDRL